jgi:hypothetical protein
MVNAFRSQLGELSISEISVIEFPICLSDLWDATPFRLESSVSCPRKSSASLKLKWSSKGQIHNAISEGNEYVVRMLLALGSDIEELDRQDKTPLAHAVLSNNEVMVKLLCTGEGANTEALKALGSRIDHTGRF